MPVKYSPAALGVNFNIESNDHPGGASEVVIRAVGAHQFTAAGLRAVISRANTYLGTTLTAAQVQNVTNNTPDGILRVASTHVRLRCQTMDVATLAAGFASDLQAAGAVVFG